MYKYFNTEVVSRSDLSKQVPIQFLNVLVMCFGVCVSLSLLNECQTIKNFHKQVVSSHAHVTHRSQNATKDWLYEMESL